MTSNWKQAQCCRLILNTYTTEIPNMDKENVELDDMSIATPSEEPLKQQGVSATTHQN